MRILINDFAGHPFQAQLSREMARHGHAVLHTYLSGLQGPKGALQVREGDPKGLAFRPLCTGRTVQKYSLWSRWLTHRQYAQALKDQIVSWKPHVVLSGNMPIDAQHEVQRFCRARRVNFIHWMQDLYCLAVESLLRRRFGAAGALMARRYFGRERSVCREADAVVMIAPAFAEFLNHRGVPCRSAHVIENWAPLEELPPVERDNVWRSEHGLDEEPTFVYSGTLGMKHRPELLWQLATAFERDSSGQLLVVSEGIGREYLDGRTRRELLPRLRTLDYQPYERLPQTLGAADVLVAIIDSEASRFAVPSKVLSYLCAGRPVLLASPPDNLAADVVRRADAGLVTHPEDTKAFLRSARRLREDGELRQRLAQNARRYAVENFDIGKITARFESICESFMHRILPSIEDEEKIEIYEASSCGRCRWIHWGAPGETSEVGGLLGPRRRHQAP